MSDTILEFSISATAPAGNGGNQVLGGSPVQAGSLEDILSGNSNIFTNSNNGQYVATSEQLAPYIDPGYTVAVIHEVLRKAFKVILTAEHKQLGDNAFNNFRKVVFNDNGSDWNGNFESVNKMPLVNDLQLDTNIGNFSDMVLFGLTGQAETAYGTGTGQYGPNFPDGDVPKWFQFFYYPFVAGILDFLRDDKYVLVATEGLPNPIAKPGLHEEDIFMAFAADAATNSPKALFNKPDLIDATSFANWHIKLDPDNGVNLAENTLKFVGNFTISAEKFREFLKNKSFDLLSEGEVEGFSAVNNPPHDPSSPISEQREPTFQGDATHYVDFNIDVTSDYGKYFYAQDEARLHPRWAPKSYIERFKFLGSAAQTSVKQGANAMEEFGWNLPLSFKQYLSAIAGDSDHQLRTLQLFNQKADFDYEVLSGESDGLPGGGEDQSPTLTSKDPMNPMHNSGEGFNVPTHLWLGLAGRGHWGDYYNYPAPTHGKGLPQGTRVKAIGPVIEGGSGRWQAIEICSDDLWFKEEGNTTAYSLWTQTSPDKPAKIYVHAGWLTRFKEEKKDLPIVPTNPNKLKPPPPIASSFALSTDLETNNEWTKMPSGIPKFVWNQKEGVWQYWVTIASKRNPNPEDPESTDLIPGDEFIEDDGDSEEGIAVEQKEFIKAARDAEKKKRIEEAASTAVGAILAYYDTDAVYNTVDTEGNVTITMNSSHPDGEIIHETLVGFISNLSTFMSTIPGDPEPYKILFALPANLAHGVPKNHSEERFYNRLTEICKEQCFHTSFLTENMKPSVVKSLGPSALGINDKVKKLVEILESYKEDIEEFKEEGGSVISYDVDAEVKDLKNFVPVLEKLLKKQSEHGFFDDSLDVFDKGPFDDPIIGNMPVTEDGFNTELQGNSPFNHSLNARALTSDAYNLVKNGFREGKSDMFMMWASNSLRPFAITWLPVELMQETPANFQKLLKQTYPLSIGLDHWASDEETITNTRTLGYIFYANEMITDWDLSKEKPPWIEFISKWSYPPPVITSELNQSDTLKDCIKKLKETKKFRVKTEDDLVEENIILADTACMSKFLEAREKSNQFIADDFMRPDELLARAESIDTFWRIYREFFQRIDANGLIAMLMSCLSKQLGLELTSQALCEAAFTKLIESVGIYNAVDKLVQIAPELGPVMPQIMAQAGIPYPDPNKQGWAQENNLDPDQIADPQVRQAMSEKWKNSPIAFAVLMGMANDDNNLSESDLKTVSLISALESGGTRIDLVPTPIGAEVKFLTDGSLVEEMSSYALDTNIGDIALYDPSNVKAGRERAEIRRRELESEGYNSLEQDKKMLEEGILTVRVYESEGIINDFFNAADELFNSTPMIPFSTNASTGESTYIDTANIAVNFQKVKGFIEACKEYIDLQRICEELVQLVLDVPALMFDGPNGFKGIGDRFLDIFELPQLPKFSMPRRLPTRNLFSGYTDKLIEAGKQIVYETLRQILTALVEELVRKCLEEAADNQSAGLPAETTGTAQFPDDFDIARLPTSNFGTPVDSINLESWLRDVFGILNPREICYLFTGQASANLVKKILKFTKVGYPQIFKNLNTIRKMKYFFTDLGESLGEDLEICNMVPEFEEVFDTLCEATFNHEERCNILQSHGLTEEECQEQINREINSLKDKLRDLALLDTPLQIPEMDMCKSGFFSLPETMKHSTRSALNGLFSTVNISFNQDLDVIREKYLPVGRPPNKALQDMGTGVEPGLAVTQFETESKIGLSEIKNPEDITGMGTVPNYLRSQEGKQLVWNSPEFWSSTPDPAQLNTALKDPTFNFPIYSPQFPDLPENVQTKFYGQVKVSGLPHCNRIIDPTFTLSQYFEGWRFPENITAASNFEETEIYNEIYGGTQGFDDNTGINIFDFILGKTTDVIPSMADANIGYSSQEVFHFKVSSGQVGDYEQELGFTKDDYEKINNIVQHVIEAEVTTSTGEKINPYDRDNWGRTFADVYNLQAYHKTIYSFDDNKEPEWSYNNDGVDFKGIVFLHPDPSGPDTTFLDKVLRPHYWAVSCDFPVNDQWQGVGGETIEEKYKQIGNIQLYDNLRNNYKFFSGIKTLTTLGDDGQINQSDLFNETGYLKKVTKNLEWELPNLFSFMNDQEKEELQKNIAQLTSNAMLDDPETYNLGGLPDVENIQLTAQDFYEKWKKGPRVRVSHTLKEGTVPLMHAEEIDVLLQPGETTDDYDFLGDYKYEVLASDEEVKLELKGRKDINSQVIQLLEELEIEPLEISNFYNNYDETDAFMTPPADLKTNKKAALFARFISKKLQLATNQNDNNAYEDVYKNLEYFLARYCWHAIRGKNLGKVFRESANSKYLRRGPLQLFFSRINPSPTSILECPDPSNVSIPSSFATIENKFYDPSSLVDDALIRYEKLKCQEMYEGRIFEDGLNSLQVATLEMIVKSMIRIYVCEILVLSLPTLGKFKLSDIQENVLIKFIISNMKRDLGRFTKLSWDEVTRKANSLIKEEEQEIGSAILSNESAVSYLIRKEINKVFSLAEEKDMLGSSRSMEQRAFANNSIGLTPHVINISSPIPKIREIIKEMPQGNYFTQGTDEFYNNYLSLYTRMAESFGNIAQIYNYETKSQLDIGNEEILNDYINEETLAVNGVLHFQNRFRAVTQPTFNQFFKTAPGVDSNKADLYKINTEQSNHMAKKITNKIVSLGAWDPYSFGLATTGKDVEMSGYDGFYAANDQFRDLLLQDVDNEGGFIIEPYLFIEDIPSMEANSGDDPNYDASKSGNARFNPGLSEENTTSNLTGAEYLRDDLGLKGYVNPAAWASLMYQYQIWFTGQGNNGAVWADWPGYNLSDYFAKWKIGLRLSYVLPSARSIYEAPEDPASYDHFTSDIIDGVSLDKSLPNYVAQVLDMEHGLAKHIREVVSVERLTKLKSLLQYEFTNNPNSDKSFYQELKDTASVIMNGPNDNVSKLWLSQILATQPIEIANVISIPLVEVSQEVNFDGNKLIFEDGSEASLNDYFSDAKAVSFLSKCNDIHKKMSEDIRETPEYKLIFDHIFDSKEDVFSSMLTTIYGNPSKNPKSNPAEALDLEYFFKKTKNTIFNSYIDIKNSNNYQYKNPAVAYATQFAREAGQSNTQAIDMDEIIANIVLKTPLLILKGFVEVTDPAIMTANGIIKAAYAAATAGVTIAKQVQQGLLAAAQVAFDTAKQAEQAAEYNLAAVEPPLDSITSQLEIDMTIEDVKTEVKVDGNSVDYGGLDSEVAEKIEELNEDQRSNLDSAVITYLNIHSVLQEARATRIETEDKLDTVNEETTEKLKEIQETIDDIKGSPLTLPLTTLALMPAALPGTPFVGFPPFPFGPGFGPPLTYPGLAYLATNFFDDFEIKRTEQISSPACEEVQEQTNPGDLGDDDI